MNDCFTILEAGYLILKNHCRDLPCYATLYEHVSDNTLSTHAGQTMDFVEKNNLPELTLEKLRKVQIAKTSDFLFYMPLSMAMSITGYVCEAINVFILNKLISFLAARIMSQSKKLVMKWAIIISAKMIF